MTSARQMFPSRFSLTTLPRPLKVPATCFLLTMGVGYLFAVAYLYLTAVQPHANRTLAQVIVFKYHGDRGSSRLESSLQGSMQGYATSEERQKIIGWTREGTGEAQFAAIRPILTQSCARCHSIDLGMRLAPLTTYAEVVIPFLAIWLDIGSWWFTRWEPLFASTVIGGGVLMGDSLAGQIVLSLYEMWAPSVLGRQAEGTA